MGGERGDGVRGWSMVLGVVRVWADGVRSGELDVEWGDVKST